LAVTGAITVNGVGDASYLSIEALPDGGFIAAWMGDDGETVHGGSSGGVFAQRFDASGQKVGRQFLVNQEQEGHQGLTYYQESIAVLTGGDVVFAWQWLDDMDGFRPSP